MRGWTKWIVGLLLSVMTPGMARADDSRLRLVGPAPDDFGTVHQARPISGRSLAVALLGGYGEMPIGSDAVPSDQRAYLHAALALGILDFIELGVVMPVHLSLAGHATAHGWDASPDGGLDDLVFHAKLAVPFFR